MRKPAHGFTLIELLVVMSIMAIIAVFTLANYSTTGNEQKLKNTLLDLQSQLRTAQTNAVSNVKCRTAYSATWEVEYTTTTATMRCSEPAASPAPKGVLTFASSGITPTFSGTPVSGATCSPVLPFTVGFAPVSGRISFGDPNCVSLIITLTRSGAGSRSLTIEQGGRIYEQ